MGADEGAEITDGAPLMVTEGDIDGSQFVVTLTSPALGGHRRDGPLQRAGGVSVDPTSVIMSNLDIASDPITVTAGHDRNVSSDEVEITATASGHANYSGATGAFAVTVVDDDYSLTSNVSSVTEETPFADASPPLGDVHADVAGGCRATGDDALQLGDADSDDYVFIGVRYSTSGVRAPYDPTEDNVPISTIEFEEEAEGRSGADVWLLAIDDTEDEPLETIQIGEDQIGEVGRIEPIMITIVDSDPEVTLSIEEVDEGAEDMTVTVTATAAGPMPGIFEIPASAWAPLSAT